MSSFPPLSFANDSSTVNPGFLLVHRVSYEEENFALQGTMIPRMKEGHKRGKGALQPYPILRTDMQTSEPSTFFEKHHVMSEGGWKTRSLLYCIKIKSIHRKTVSPYIPTRRQTKPFRLPLPQGFMYYARMKFHLILSLSVLLSWSSRVISFSTNRRQHHCPSLPGGWTPTPTNPFPHGRPISPTTWTSTSIRREVKSTTAIGRSNHLTKRSAAIAPPTFHGNPVYVLTAILWLSTFGVSLERQTTVGKALSAPLATMALALTTANLGLVPFDSPICKKRKTKRRETDDECGILGSRYRFVVRIVRLTRLFVFFLYFVIP